MEFARPPPNLNMPPPNSMGPPMGPPGGLGRGGHRPPYHRPFGYQMRFPPAGPMNMTQDDFDGKRLRKSVMRKTVDYNAAIIKAIEGRVWQRDWRDRHALQPDAMYMPDLLPPPSYPENPTNAVTTRFVKTATNKMRCPIFAVVWTPEGRRLITGASSGEFTLWNGLTFNFETILQAHDSPVRSMVWSHGEGWMVTGDHSGYVKYWQSNMNNVKMFQAHKEAVRGISFSPSDSKIVTCSDDGTLRIFDFYRCQEEKILRGHGADVKCVQWHPTKALIVSGSKDNQQPIKLWDPKSGLALSTLHAHKSTVMDLKWNDNGNWLITASRDHLLKLFDIRKMGTELQIFRGHKKEASSVAWHPTHEGLFASGGSDGAIMFWNVGTDKEVGCIEGAHESIVWTLAWHPLGHILCSGSNDHTSKFWTRNRPGDQMRDKYNLNTLPPGVQDDHDLDEPSVIPGICPEDKVEIFDKDTDKAIPGLDLDTSVLPMDTEKKVKKVPYSKPIPRNFQVQWNTGSVDDGTTEVLTQALVESVPGVVPLQNIAPSAIIIYGKLIPVEPGSRLEAAIAEGPQALKKFIASGEIEELHDVMPHLEDDEEDTSSAQFIYPTNTQEGNTDSPTDDSYDNYNNDRNYRNNFNVPPPGNFNKPPSLFDTVFDPNNPPFVPQMDNSYNEEQNSYDNGQNEDYQDVDGGGDNYGNQGDNYGNQNDDYSNDGDSYGNEGDAYGNESDSYHGNQNDSFGNQGDGYGNQGDNFGNQRGGYGNQRWQRGFQRGMGRGRGMNMNGHGRGRGGWNPRERGPRGRRPGGNRPYWRGGRNK